MTLDNLRQDQQAIVLKIVENGLTSKLIDMGLYPGKTISVVFKAPFGDPIAIDIDGYTLSLRREEAALVEVQ